MVQQTSVKCSKWNNWGEIMTPVLRKARTVEKPWGKEQIFGETKGYVGKILHIKAGEALSLQYHRVKDETIMVLSGRLRFEHFVNGSESPGVEVLELQPGEPFHIAPNVRHRMTAIEDAAVLEVSTPEIDDVVRLDDRYGRVPGANP